MLIFRTSLPDKVILCYVLDSADLAFQIDDLSSPSTGGRMLTCTKYLLRFEKRAIFVLNCRECSTCPTSAPSSKAEYDYWNCEEDACWQLLKPTMATRFIGCSPISRGWTMRFRKPKHNWPRDSVADLRSAAPLSPRLRCPPNRVFQFGKYIPIC